MSEHPNLALIHAYNEAWLGGDMAATARYLAPDVSFDSPNQHLRGREAFIAVLDRFRQRVTGPMAIISEFADDAQVLMLYDLPVGPLGMVRVCDHFSIAGGLISANKLLFDTAPFSQAPPAPPPTPA